MENVMERKSEKYSENAEAFQCSVIKLSLVVDKFTEEVMLQLQEHISSSCEKDFFLCSKDSMQWISYVQ